LAVTRIRRMAIPIIRIRECGDSNLPQIGHTLSRFGGILGLLQRRQQHRSEDRDDGDDDKQFYQAECTETRVIKSLHARLELPKSIAQVANMSSVNADGSGTVAGIRKPPPLSGYVRSWRYELAVTRFETA